MKAIVIQHHKYETLGSHFESVLTDAGFGIVTVPVFLDAPTFESFDAPHPTRDDIVVSLGGPMSANDGLPALEQEMSYLRQAAEDGIRVIGYAWVPSCSLGRSEEWSNPPAGTSSV